MSHRLHPWTRLVIHLCLLIAIVCCSKPKPSGNPDPLPPPAPSVYEALLSIPTVTYCGEQFTSDLLTKDGTVIGTVLVGNDNKNLYLNYNLKNNWYLTSAESYAGQKSLIPLTASGSPDQSRFPGKKSVSACDRYQKFCFKIPLSALRTDESGQCFTNAQFFIAMRATVKTIGPEGNCSTGPEAEAWAAPVLINPGNAEEWATAFYFCKQDCTPYCGYGQGYWFSKPKVDWCQSEIHFGNLSVTKDDARALWPAQNNEVKKAFFQASALQLSLACNNKGRPTPSAIADDYKKVSDFLSGLSYTDIINGTYPTGTDINAVKTAASNIGKWICENNCNSLDDPTVCQ